MPNYYQTNTVHGTNGYNLLRDDVGTVQLLPGWVVGTGSTNRSKYQVGVERAESTFDSTTYPTGTLDDTLKDALLIRDSQMALGNSIQFAAGNWVFNFRVRAVTNGGAQDGRIHFRVLKGNNTVGRTTTEITSGIQDASIVTNVSTSADFTSTLTVALPLITLTANAGDALLSESLYIQIAWGRTGAGGMSTADIAFQCGQGGSLVGTYISSPTRTVLSTPTSLPWRRDPLSGLYTR